MRIFNVFRQLARIDRAERLRARMIKLSNKRDALRAEIQACKRELLELEAAPANRDGLIVGPRGFQVER